jgi:hypothetical protein
MESSRNQRLEDELKKSKDEWASLTMTRLDIAYAVGLLCHYMAAPTTEHLLAAKRIMRYHAGTPSIGIIYKKGGDTAEGFGDADYAADVGAQRSRSGSLVMKNGGALIYVEQ